MMWQELYPNDAEESIVQIILMIVLIFQIFIKILFFMKVFDDYGFLVQMIQISILDAAPFMSFFFLWVLFFTVEFKLLQWEVDDEEYSQLPSILQLFLLSFRNSMGDLSLPAYSNWTDWCNDGSEPAVGFGTCNAFNYYGSSSMIYLLWFFWFINIFLMLIILLNFLIAVISATYEKVNSQKTNYTYKDKSEMNEECCTILKSLYNKGEVKMICFTYDKKLTIIQESDFKEVIDEIKKNVKAATDDINETIYEIGE